MAPATFGKKSGRWGKMIAVKGAKVQSASWTSTYDPFGDSIFLGERILRLETANGETPTVVGEFETLERYLNDDKTETYLTLKPRPHSPYRLVTSTSQNVDESIKGSDGRCLRVRDHDTRTQKGYLAGILLHEAAHPGYLKGCIAPFPKDNRQLSHDFRMTHRAMNEVYGLVKKAGGAGFIVMD